jgi:hypothetical protein
MQAQTRPLFASKAHDAEVIDHCVRKVAPYKNYTCVYAGFGTLVFQGPGEDQVHVDVHSDSADWLDNAWDAAREAIDMRVTTVGELTH